MDVRHDGESGAEQVLNIIISYCWKVLLLSLIFEGVLIDELLSLLSLLLLLLLLEEKEEEEEEDDGLIVVEEEDEDSCSLFVLLESLDGLGFVSFDNVSFTFVSSFVCSWSWSAEQEIGRGGGKSVTGDGKLS